MSAVTCPGSGSKLDQVLRLADRPIAGLLLDLATRGVGRFLALLDETAEQLVTPLISREPISPQHQHPVTLIHDQSDGDPRQVDYVVLPPLTVRSLDVSKPQLHPLVVIDQSLTVRLPSSALLSHASSLGPSGSGSHNNSLMPIMGA